VAREASHEDGTRDRVVRCRAAVGNRATIAGYGDGDTQGTVVAEMTPQGQVTYEAAYRPYGQQVTGVPQVGPGYTGHVNDPDTGLVYMQQRYYDPDVGRFLSADPVGSMLGDAFNFNRYAYANNSPAMLVDPTGMHTASEGDMDLCSSVYPCGTMVFGNGDGGGSSGRATEFPKVSRETMIERRNIANDYVKKMSAALQGKEFKSVDDAKNVFSRIFAKVSALLSVEFSANIIDFGAGHVLLTDFDSGQYFLPDGSGRGSAVSSVTPSVAYLSGWWGWIHTHTSNDGGFSWSDVSNYLIGRRVNGYLVFPDETYSSFSINKWKASGMPPANYVYWNQKQFSLDGK
jgi:RHS repeat-associated protein